VWTAIGSCAGVVAAGAAIVPLTKNRKSRASAALDAPAAAQSGAPAPSSAAAQSGAAALSGAPAPPGAAGAVSDDIFISYAHQDRAWVRELVNALEGKGVSVAYDELIMGPGGVVVHKLDDAILSSVNGLLVYSQAAMASRWVNAEYATLMQRAIEGGRLFIPVIIEDVPPLPPFAESRYRADFRNADAATYHLLVDQIARAVRQP
jgi:hypothetical protein